MKFFNKIIQELILKHCEITSKQEHTIKTREATESILFSPQPKAVQFQSTTTIMTTQRSAQGFTADAHKTTQPRPATPRETLTGKSTRPS